MGSLSPLAASFERGGHSPRQFMATMRLAQRPSVWRRRHAQGTSVRRDDVAKRFMLICNEMCLGAISDELLVVRAASARERCALAARAALTSCVSSQAARHASTIAFRSRENYPSRLDPAFRSIECVYRARSVVLTVPPSRWLLLCNRISDPAWKDNFPVLTALELTLENYSPRSGEPGNRVPSFSVIQIAVSVRASASLRRRNRVARTP